MLEEFRLSYSFILPGSNNVEARQECQMLINGDKASEETKGKMKEAQNEGATKRYNND